MSINKLLLIATLLLIPSTATQATNYRPYISTTLAKIIITKDVDPDENTELCDGSGWITHGDGHKTECPGCKACQDRARPEKTCKCNTKSTYCDCVNQYGKCRCKPRPMGSSGVGLIIRFLSRFK